MLHGAAEVGGPETLVFLTDLVYLQEEGPQRGPKGAVSDDAGRSGEGRFVGIEGASYIILTTKGTRITRSEATPLNEWILVERGQPREPAGVAVSVQTDAISALPPLPAPAAPARRLLKFARLTGDPVNRGPC